jgi:preprotein translocase subunit SecG
VVKWLIGYWLINYSPLTNYQLLWSLVMLSFLREQSFGNSDEQKSTENISDNDAGALTNLKGQEYLTVSAQNKNLQRSTILLTTFFIIGFLCLWLMIKKSSPQTASAAPDENEETQIELAIARLTGVKSEMFDSMDEIVKKFYEFSNVFQVQVSELIKNPFELELFLTNLRKKSDADNANLEFNDEILRLQQLKKQASDMQLLSIIQLNNSICCMIEDKILREGDSIKGFKVTQIGNNFVKLKWDQENDLLRQDCQIGIGAKSWEIILRLSE